MRPVEEEEAFLMACQTLESCVFLLFSTTDHADEAIASRCSVVLLMQISSCIRYGISPYWEVPGYF